MGYIEFSPDLSISGRHRPGRKPGRWPDGTERKLHRALFAIFVEAAGALIEQLVLVGIVEPADIARRLNRRGFPCWGRARWSAGLVAMVLRRRAWLAERG